MSEWYINYDEQGKILGFSKGTIGNNIKLSNEIWSNTIDNGYNKIIIDKDKNISFEKVDWKTPEEIEVERIQSIKAKAGEIIKSKYSIEWQLNHPRLDATYAHEYVWIDNIRRISNEAEANGTALEDIDWGI